MSNSRHIAVVDDDREVRACVAVSGEAGFRVTARAGRPQSARLLASQHIDLIVLDVMLPGGEDGLTICRRWHEAQIPIIMLTARSDDVDRICRIGPTTTSPSHSIPASCWPAPH